MHWDVIQEVPNEAKNSNPISNILNSHLLMQLQVTSSPLRGLTRMYELTKRQRSRLRQLAAECHERELENAMTKLYEEFQKWGCDRVSVFELNDKVHEFHDGVSRELYKRYVMIKPQISVAYALRQGILSREEIGDDLPGVFSHLIDELPENSG